MANKFLKLLLTSALLLATYQLPVHAILQETSQQQIKDLFYQVNVLSAHGISHEEILAIFEQNLAQEKLSAAKPNPSQRLLLAGLVCITFLGIGVGSTYYFMNKKLNEKDTEITQLTANRQQLDTLNQQLQAEVTRLNQPPAQQQPPQPQQPRRMPHNVNLENLVQQLEQAAGQPNQNPENILENIMQNPEVVNLLRILR